MCNRVINTKLYQVTIFLLVFIILYERLSHNFVRVTAILKIINLKDLSFLFRLITFLKVSVGFKLLEISQTTWYWHKLSSFHGVNISSAVKSCCKSKLRKNIAKWILVLWLSNWASLFIDIILNCKFLILKLILHYFCYLIWI